MDALKRGLLVLLISRFFVTWYVIWYTTRQITDNKIIHTAQTPYTIDEFYFADSHASGINGLAYKFTIIDWTPYHAKLNWEPIISGNCLVTRNKSLSTTSDVIAISSRKLSSLTALPTDRKPFQLWIWMQEESPFHAVHPTQPFGLDDLRDMFNWTMTYRSDSDVYIPYGYTFKLGKSRIVYDSLFDNKSHLAAAVISNCFSSSYSHNGRFSYITEQSKYINVTMYGRCGTVCAGYRQLESQQESHCLEIKKFKFYLSFENSNCREYVTEKMFVHGFAIGSVPVVMGAPKNDYIKLAPPNSFIFAGDFSQPQDLANYLVKLSNNKREYMKYHAWRRHYDIKCRILYYSDFIWSALCRKLNSVPKMQGVQSHLDLGKFWNVSRECDVSRNYL